MKTICLLAAALFLPLSWQDSANEQDKKDVKKPAEAAFFEIDELIEQRQDSKKAYLQFFRNSDLRTGIYHLKAGARDGQSPHTEDEIYHVLSGKGRFTAGDEEREVSAGSVIFVAKNIEHRFHDIEEDLNILVFFASAPK
ncbi:MAG: cupin domain-containing protein [Planctomycetota bacterium]|jgi:quercetin dioxygenase-like cupin family protein